jgi:hypothetical protein
MELCNCGRGEKVMFVCNKKSCENYENQRLYCIECNNDNPPPHDHRGEFIVSDSTVYKNEWKDIRMKVQQCFAASKAWTTTHKPLLEILSPDN